MACSGQLSIPMTNPNIQTNYLETLQEENNRLKRSLAELKFLNDLATAIGALRSPQQILEKIIHRSLQAVGGEQGVITLIAEQSQHRVKTLVRTMEASSSKQPIHLDQYLLAWVHRHKKSLWMNEPHHDSRFRGVRWDSAVRSVICVPLLVKSVLIGVLTVYNKKDPGGFTTDDQRLLAIIGSQSAQVIENARLSEQERVQAIERAILEQKLNFEREEANRQRELNRLKSFFVSSVSHDLKDPLTSIRLNAERLLREKGKISATKLQDRLNTMIGESEKLTRLIDNVLEFSRLERGIKQYQFSELDLNEVVTKVLQSLQYQLDLENCSAEISLCPHLPPIKGDRDEIARLLENLISNALKYRDSNKGETRVTLGLHVTRNSRTGRAPWRPPSRVSWSCVG